MVCYVILALCPGTKTPKRTQSMRGATWSVAASSTSPVMLGARCCGGGSDPRGVATGPHRTLSAAVGAIRLLWSTLHHPARFLRRRPTSDDWSSNGWVWTFRPQHARRPRRQRQASDGGAPPPDPVALAPRPVSAHWRQPPAELSSPPAGRAASPGAPSKPQYASRPSHTRSRRRRGPRAFAIVRARRRVSQPVGSLLAPPARDRRAELLSPATLRSQLATQCQDAHVPGIHRRHGNVRSDPCGHGGVSAVRRPVRRRAGRAEPPQRGIAAGTPTGGARGASVPPPVFPPGRRQAAATGASGVRWGGCQPDRFGARWGALG